MLTFIIEKKNNHWNYDLFHGGFSLRWWKLWQGPKRRLLHMSKGLWEMSATGTRNCPHRHLHLSHRYRRGHRCHCRFILKKLIYFSKVCTYCNILKEVFFHFDLNYRLLYFTEICIVLVYWSVALIQRCCIH